MTAPKPRLCVDCKHHEPIGCVNRDTGATIISYHRCHRNRPPGPEPASLVTGKPGSYLYDLLDCDDERNALIFGCGRRGRYFEPA